MMTIVGASFVAFSRRITHAGSVYAYIAFVFGPHYGFIAGWTLLFTYLTYASSSSALVGGFLQAALHNFGAADLSWSWVVTGVAAVPPGKLFRLSRHTSCHTADAGARRRFDPGHTRAEQRHCRRSRAGNRGDDHALCAFGGIRRLVGCRIRPGLHGPFLCRLRGVPRRSARRQRTPAAASRSQARGRSCYAARFSSLSRTRR
jgi:hypothetical protein